MWGGGTVPISEGAFGLACAWSPAARAGLQRPGEVRMRGHCHLPFTGSLECMSITGPASTPHDATV